MYFVNLDLHHLNQFMINMENDKIHVKFVQDVKLKINVINLLQNYLHLIQIINLQEITGLYYLIETVDIELLISFSYIFYFIRPQQAKYIDKVMIPQEDYPDVNFIGLIIGPRGSTLKMLEKEVCLVVTSSFI
jgi:hypothetical protein